LLRISDFNDWCEDNNVGLGAKFLSSSLARQPLVGPGLLKKLCPFASVEGKLLSILDL
jgi:hypothetical protein